MRTLAAFAVCVALFAGLAWQVAGQRAGRVAGSAARARDEHRVPLAPPEYFDGHYADPATMPTLDERNRRQLARIRALSGR